MSKSQIERAGGNPELMILGVFYAFIGAGLYEEFMFRGFLMHGLAMFFGAGRGAWIVACVLQGALFAAADAYQNPLGIAITAILGVLMGLIVLALGRNLWPVNRTRTLRRESFRFVLFRRPAGGLSPSAIQQTGIEAIFDRLANLDFIKIRMPRI